MQRLHAPQTEHRPLPSSKRELAILSAVFSPAGQPTMIEIFQVAHRGGIGFQLIGDDGIVRPSRPFGSERTDRMTSCHPVRQTATKTINSLPTLDPVRPRHTLALVRTSGNGSPRRAGARHCWHGCADCPPQSCACGRPPRCAGQHRRAQDDHIVAESRAPVLLYSAAYAIVAVVPYSWGGENEDGDWQGTHQYLQYLIAALGTIALVGRIESNAEILAWAASERKARIALTEAVRSARHLSPEANQSIAGSVDRKLELEYQTESFSDRYSADLRQCLRRDLKG